MSIRKTRSGLTTFLYSLMLVVGLVGCGSGDDEAGGGLTMIVMPPPSGQREQEPNNRLSMAQPVNLPLNGLSASISPTGDRDWYRFTLSSTRTVTIYTTGSTDTFGQLLTSTNENPSDDDGYDGRNFQFDRTLAPGTHYVEVIAYRHATTGDYSLYIQLP